jgi:hypothetical protein
MAKYPIQTRTLNPFSEYYASEVNILTRAVTLGQNCIDSLYPIEVSVDSTNPLTNVIISTGQCFKDDVYISLDDINNIDLRDGQYYLNSPYMTEEGPYYLCLRYSYIVSKPAPRAYIQILKPSQRELFTDEYLMLSVVNVVYSPSDERFIIESLSDYDYLIPSNGRVYTHSTFGFSNTLPVFDLNTDLSRVIYVRDEDVVYYGTSVGWKALSETYEYTCDTRTCEIGNFVYVGEDNIALLADSTSVLTYAEGVVTQIGLNGKIKIAGAIRSDKVEPGITISAGDPIILSRTAPGCVTNSVSSRNLQVLGICTHTLDGYFYCLLSMKGTGGGVVDHNMLFNIQGGSSENEEYYHLTLAQVNKLNDLTTDHELLDNLMGGDDNVHYHLSQEEYDNLGIHNSLSEIQGGIENQRYHLDETQYNYVSAYSGYHNYTAGIQGGDDNDKYHLTRSEWESIHSSSGFSGYHNSLPGIQGGIENQRYHLDETQYNYVSAYSGYHNLLDGFQGGQDGQRYHLTQQQWENLAPFSGYHSELVGLQGGSPTERYHLSLAELQVVQSMSGFSGYNHNDLANIQGGIGNQRYHLSGEAYIRNVTGAPTSEGSTRYAKWNSSGYELNSSNIADFSNDGINGITIINPDYPTFYSSIGTNVSGYTQLRDTHQEKMLFDIVTHPNSDGDGNLARITESGKQIEDSAIPATRITQIISTGFSGYHNTMIDIRGGLPVERYHVNENSSEIADTLSNDTYLLSSLESLENAVSVIGTEIESTLIIDMDSTCLVELSIPENIALLFKSPYCIFVADGIQLTIEGNIIAGTFSIFKMSLEAGTQIIIQNRTTEVSPEWWGGCGDTFDFDLECAVRSTSNIRFSDKTYTFTGTDDNIILNPGQKLLGSAIGKTILNHNGTGYLFSIYNERNVEISDLTVSTELDSDAVVRGFIRIMNYSKNIIIRNCYFMSLGNYVRKRDPLPGAWISIERSQHVTIKDCKFSGYSHENGDSCCICASESQDIKILRNEINIVTYFTIIERCENIIIDKNIADDFFNTMTGVYDSFLYIDSFVENGASSKIYVTENILNDICFGILQGTYVNTDSIALVTNMFVLNNFFSTVKRAFIAFKNITTYFCYNIKINGNMVQDIIGEDPVIYIEGTWSNIDISDNITRLAQTDLTHSLPIIYMLGSESNNILHVNISNNKSQKCGGVYLNNIKYLKVENNNIEVEDLNSSFAGIEIDESTDVMISQNYLRGITTTSKYGIYINNSDVMLDLYIVGNIIDNFLKGIYALNIENFNIKDNNISNSLTDQTSNNVGIHTRDGSNGNIIGNTISSAIYGILSVEQDDMNISSNKINVDDQSVISSGIYIDASISSPVYHILINSNTVFGAMYDMGAIIVSVGDDVTITQNDISNSNMGIYAYECVHMNISDNQVSQVYKAGIMADSNNFVAAEIKNNLVFVNGVVTDEDTIGISVTGPNCTVSGNNISGTARTLFVLDQGQTIKDNYGYFGTETTGAPYIGFDFPTNCSNITLSPNKMVAQVSNHVRYYDLTGCVPGTDFRLIGGKVMTSSPTLEQGTSETDSSVNIDKNVCVPILFQADCFIRGDQGTEDTFVCSSGTTIGPLFLAYYTEGTFNETGQVLYSYRGINLFYQEDENNPYHVSYVSSFMSTLAWNLTTFEGYVTFKSYYLDDIIGFQVPTLEDITEMSPANLR